MPYLRQSMKKKKFKNKNTNEKTPLNHTFNSSSLSYGVL